MHDHEQQFRHFRIFILNEHSHSAAPAAIDSGQSCAAAARKFNTTPKTVAKWVKRFR